MAFCNDFQTLLFASTKNKGNSTQIWNDAWNTKADFFRACMLQKKIPSNFSHWFCRRITIENATKMNPKSKEEYFLLLYSFMKFALSWIFVSLRWSGKKDWKFSLQEKLDCVAISHWIFWTSGNVGFNESISLRYISRLILPPPPAPIFRVIFLQHFAISWPGTCSREKQGKNNC